MKRTVYYLIFCISGLLVLNQSFAKTNVDTSVVWKCPAASAIHVQRTYDPSTYNFEWNANIISSTGVSIPMWGIHNPQYPTSVKGTLLWDDQVLLCEYNTSDKICIEGYCRKYGNMLTHGTSAWRPLPGKNCHYTTQGNKGLCSGDAVHCSVTCD